MDVYCRDRRFYRRAYIDIGLTGKGWVNTTLQAYFGCSPLPGLTGEVGNFGWAFQVRGVTRRRIFSALGKSAEMTTVAADIGVIDVPVDYIADRVAAD